MYAVLKSFGLKGLNGFPVEVEADISGGMPALSIVGLPDSAVRESGDRVHSALKNLGFKWPDRRITINLAPADVRKTGPVYDLPLLLAVLALAGGLEEPLSELLLSALACAGIALIMNAVALPLLLKFGAEKARMVSMALFLLVFAGFALLGLAADRGLALPAPPAWVLTALPGLLAILAVGGFALSYCIAQAIYARKEF